MYQKLKVDDFRKHYQLPDDYQVSGLLVMGHWNVAKYTKQAKTHIQSLFGADTKIEKPISEFLTSVLSFIVDGKRYWLDCVYGQTYLSELVHIASLFGSKQNILMGSCGGLNPHGHAGDIVVPRCSFANESSARMYDRENKEYLYYSDKSLSEKLVTEIGSESPIFRGTMMTVQAMLGETEEDVLRWSKEGYDAVDMESGVIFAVSNFFKVPSAALLYIADNLIAGNMSIRTNMQSRNPFMMQKRLTNLIFV